MHHAPSLVLVIAATLLAACGGKAGGDGPDAAPDDPDAERAPDAAGAPDAAPPIDVIAIPLSSSDGGYYTANVRLGSQSFAMLVDSSSPITVVASSACTSCPVSPLYTPGSTATDTQMTATVNNGDTGWSGEIYLEQIGLGAQAPTLSVALASITSQHAFFDGNDDEFQGVLGVGPDGQLIKGTTSYLDQVVATAALPDVASFQLCDADGGTMWLGGYDPSATAAAPQYTAMNSVQPFYAFTLEDMKVGGASVGFTPQITIADTGTPLFFVPKAAAAGVLAQANQAANVFAVPFVDQQGIWCAMAKSGVTRAQIDSTLPPLVLTLPGTTGSSFTISAPPTRSYMLDAGGGLWCVGVVDNSGVGRTLMGTTGLRGFVTIFDRINRRVGFAPEHGC